MKDKNNEILNDIKNIISQARSLTRKSVNSLQVLSNYLIGKRIVEEEQSGNKRADYGKETLNQLSIELTKEFGRGYSHRNLEYMRKFFLYYKDRLSISQTLSAKLVDGEEKALSKQLELTKISQTVSAKLPLSWSHYLFLMGVSSTEERNFYEIAYQA
jgi:hypothetical protein